MSELFTTYERVKTERVTVATITDENIHEVAKLAEASVHYSSAKPYILQEGVNWPVGRVVRLMGKKLVNMNGFNRTEDWKEVPNE